MEMIQLASPNNPSPAITYLNKINVKQSLSLQTFDKWRKFIYEKTGIYYQDNKKYLLESRLQKRIQHLKIDNFEKYFDYIRLNSENSSEIKYLYEAITINETFFFRNQPQLDAIVSNVIPELLAAKEKLGKSKIRIWSAASSTGEEAYSIAMVINELLKPKYPNLEIEIVGTDISYSVIEAAKNGIYKEYSVRNTPIFYLKKYFKQTGNSYEMDPAMKNLVRFKLLNLYDEIGMKTMINFDIIFCANVLIYFDLTSKIKVIDKLYNSLLRNGFLFIGYSETLQNISKAFKIVSFPKTIGYKKE